MAVKHTTKTHKGVFLIPTTFPPVDLSRLKQITDEKQSLRFLITSYLKTTEQQLMKLSDAIQQSLADEIQYLAHSTASCSAFLGIAALVLPLRELEHMAKSRELTHVNDQLRHIQSEFHRVKQYLKTQLC